MIITVILFLIIFLKVKTCDSKALSDKNRKDTKMNQQPSKIPWISIIVGIVTMLAVCYIFTPVLDDMRKSVNPDVVTTKELVTLNKKYVIQKDIPIKYIEYSQNDPFFIFWTKKNTYVKVFYPNHKTETMLLKDVSTEYKVSDTSHKNGTKTLIYSYEDYKQNTPKSVKHTLNNYRTYMGLGPKMSPLGQDNATLKFVIYKDAK